MRILSYLAAIFMLSVMATSADARRGGGYAETLEFIQTVDLGRENAPESSLCHLVRTDKILGFVNLFRSVKTYALSENRCDSDQYLALSQENFAQLQQEGVISADLPLEPKLSLASRLAGSWGLGALGLLGVFALIKWLGMRRRTSQRKSMMGDISPVATAIVDAMCHAAKADGSVDAEEVQKIQSIAQEMTGEEMSTETVTNLANLAEQKPADNYFKSIGKNFDFTNRTLMMKAVLMVVAADGVLDKSENAFIGKLASGLKLDAPTVQNLLAEVARANNPSA